MAHPVCDAMGGINSADLAGTLSRMASGLLRKNDTAVGEGARLIAAMRDLAEHALWVVVIFWCAQVSDLHLVDIH